MPLVRYGFLRGASALGSKQAATTLVGDALNYQIGRTYLPYAEYKYPMTGTTWFAPKGNNYRFKWGDVELDNPELNYRQGKAGMAENFVRTKSQFTPLEEYYQKHPEKITLTMRAGIKPGVPLTYPNAMYSQGNLWYGVNSDLPDLLVTSKDLPFSSSKASNLGFTPKLRTAYNVGTRRVSAGPSFDSPASSYSGGLNNTNTSAYIFDNNYGYRKINMFEPKTYIIGKNNGDITANFKKFVSNNRQKASGNSEERNQLRQILKDNGVDVSQVSEDDLATALYNRQLEIKASAPTRYGLHKPGYFSREEEITAINNGQDIGRIDLLRGKDRYGIGYIENYTRGQENKVLGVSEQLYNSAILAGRSKGLKGIESGETLKSPEITVDHVFPKYENKELIGNWGNYQWSNHNLNMVDTNNNPVYLLSTPTYQAPVKSTLFRVH